MKKLLLLSFCLTTFSAQAQLAQLVGLGVGLGVNAAMSTRSGKPGEFVTKVTYKGQQFSQKRTPTAKLPKKGNIEIALVEELLQQSYTTLLADNVTELAPANHYRAFTTAMQQVRVVRPTWDVSPYEGEMTFYRLEDNNRRYRAQQLAAQQLAAQQAKARRQSDSLAIIARRQQARQDSVVAVAKARQDSVNHAAAVQALRTPVRYLNAGRTAMLVRPDAYDRPPVGEVWGGSKVTVLKALPNGWSYVDVNQVKGYLPSDKLVPVLDSVVASDVDWDGIRKYKDYAVVMTSGEHPPVAVAPAALAHPAAKPQVRTARGTQQVYVCGGGSSYAYHSTSTCAGLNRCNHGISAISKASAAGLGRQPCQRCH